MHRIEQLFIAPAKALLEDEHPHQDAERRIRVTIFVIEQSSRTIFGYAIGNLIQKDVVPGLRIVQLYLVACAQIRFDVAEQVDLAAVGTASEHAHRSAGGRSDIGRYFTSCCAQAQTPGDFSERTHLWCFELLLQLRKFRG